MRRHAALPLFPLLLASLAAATLACFTPRAVAEPDTAPASAEASAPAAPSADPSPPYPAAASSRTLEDRWDVLLARHVSRCTIASIETAVVDYAAIAKDPEFTALVAALATVPEPTDHAARLAFWINAYNVLAIDVVARAHPVASIRDIGSLLRPVWKRDAGRVAGAMRSLDEIEHEIIRPMGDPRIHAAVNCASLSCPDLRPEAYRADRLEAQLDDAMRRWLADPAKGASLAADGRTLRLSKIFDWFGADFLHDGRPLTDVLRRWMPEQMAARLGEQAPRVRYFDYDWSLNDRARCAGANP